MVKRERGCKKKSISESNVNEVLKGIGNANEDKSFVDLGLNSVYSIYDLLVKACFKKYKDDSIVSKINKMAEKIDKGKSKYKKLSIVKILMNFVEEREMFLLYLLCNWIETDLKFEDDRSFYSYIFTFGFEKILSVNRRMSVSKVTDVLPKRLVGKKVFKKHLLKNANSILRKLMALDNSIESISNYIKPKMNETFKSIEHKSDSMLFSSMNARIMPFKADCIMDKKFDIDGFYGYTHITKAHSIFKSPLNIKLIDKHDYFKARKNTIFADEIGFVKFTRCIDIKLGHVLTSFGLVDIILIIHDSNIRDKDEKSSSRKKYLHSLVEYCSKCAAVSLNALQRSVIDESSMKKILLEGGVQIQNLKEFFHGVNGLVGNNFAFIYIESYGNKHQATCPLDAYSHLINRLFDSIEVLMIPSLKIDMCITVSSGGDNITIANHNFFNSLRINPNYKLLLCNGMMNYNAYHYRVSDKNDLSYSNSMFDKLNCYSTIEDLFSEERRIKNIPRYATALIKESLYGHRLGNSTILRKKILEKLTKLKTICSGRVVKKLDYRVECRVFPFQLELALRYLNRLCVPSNFSYIDYRQFTNVFETSLEVFIGNIEFGCSNYQNADLCFTFERIAWTVVSEIVLISRYLAGNQNTHQLKCASNVIFKNDEYYSNDCIKVPSIGKIIENIISSYSSPRDIITNLVNNIYKLDDSFKKNIYELLHFWQSDNMIQDFLNLYYKLRSNYAYECYDDVKKLNIDHNELKNVYFSQWIKRNFQQNSVTRKSNFLCCSFDILKMKYGGSEAVVIDNIKDEIEKSEIKIVYYDDYNPKYIDQKYFTFGTIILDSERERERARLLDMLFRLIDGRFYTNVRCTEDELIRLIHGWFYYGSSRSKYQLVFNNFIYGFRLTRNYAWVKNRRTLFRQYFEKGDALKRLIDRAREFKPDAFNMGHINSYLKNMRKEIIDPEALDIYEQIRLIDIEKMYENSLVQTITQASDIEILKTFLTKEEIDEADHELRNLPLQVQEIVDMPPSQRESVVKARRQRNIIKNLVQQVVSETPDINIQEPVAIAEIKEKLDTIEEKIDTLQETVAILKSNGNVESHRQGTVNEIDGLVDISPIENSLDENDHVVAEMNTVDGFCTDNPIRNDDILECSNASIDERATYNSNENIDILRVDKSILLAKIKKKFKPNQKFTSSLAKKCCCPKDNRIITKDEFTELLDTLVQDNELSKFKGINLRSISYYMINTGDFQYDKDKGIYERMKSYYQKSGSKPFTPSEMMKMIFNAKSRIKKYDFEVILKSFVEKEMLLIDSTSKAIKRYKFPEKI